MTKLTTRCQAEYHAHIDGECLGKLTQCGKLDGHDMRGWHRNPDESVSWDFDHRDSCPNSPTPEQVARYEALLMGLAQGIIKRRWECYDEKSDCTEESVAMFRERTTGHQTCRWYWHLWSVDADEIEAEYQEALRWAEDVG